VEVSVETPAKLTKKQKEMLRAFDKENEEGTHPETEGFFARVKEFWGRSAE
jgi:molecular chaperone DnaJ